MYTLSELYVNVRFSMKLSFGIGPLPDLSRLPSNNSYAGLYLGVKLSCSLFLEVDPAGSECCAGGIGKSESGRDVEVESGSIL